MRKRVFALILLLFILIPIIVKADYGMGYQAIDATVKPDGSLEVEEYYYLNGDYNGSIKTLKYADYSLKDPLWNIEALGGNSLNNGTNVEILEVRGLPITNTIDFKNISGDVFTKVFSANKGDYGVYTSEYIQGGQSLTIYNPSENQKGFYIKYRIYDVAVVHEDVAEIYWKFVDNTSNESIEKLSITVHFPNNTNLRVWAHGPLHGIVQKQGEDTLVASINGLSDHTPIDVRATFDKNIVENSRKKSNHNALDKILAYEENAASKANYDRITRAEGELDICRRNPTRSCYESLLMDVKYIKDKEIREKYLKEVENIHIIVNQQEEDKAKRLIEYLKISRKYKDIIECEQAVSILENQELKEKLQAEIEMIKEEIKFKEKEDNRKFNIIAYIIIVFLIIHGFVIFWKYDKEYKPEFNQKYLRDLPEGYSPTSLSYLLKGKISKESISATVVSMVYKGMIIYHKDADKPKDFILEKNTSYNGPISEVEKRVLAMLFIKSNKISMKKLKQDAKKGSHSFANKYDNVKLSAINEAKKLKIYENHPKGNTDSYDKGKILLWIILALILIPAPYLAIPIIIFIILRDIFKKTKEQNGREEPKDIIDFSKKVNFLVLAIISIICFVLINHKRANNQFGYDDCLNTLIACEMLAVIIFIYIHKIIKRTKKGSEDVAKWKAVKNFLKDFGSFAEKEIPEVVLWEQYLVYAVVFKCASKLAKKMQLEVNEIDFKDMDRLSRYVQSGISSSISIARHEIATTSYSSGGGSSWSSGGGGSSWSSDSGGGGGFSSSSSGGGGGGGGSVSRF